MEPTMNSRHILPLVLVASALAFWLAPRGNDAASALDDAGSDSPRTRVAGAFELSPSAPTFSQEAWVEGQVLVAVRDGASLEALAARHGVGISRDLGPSGYGALEVPPGMDEAAFARDLAGDPAVLEAARMGRTWGAGKATAKNPKSLQWYRTAVDTPNTPHLDRVVVAILDTGVAYEDFEGYYQAPTLESVAFVSPYDFVNDDAHPNDDHQHGTHIASIIASNGRMMGIARKATIMPVKVLDANNMGVELDLVDGLHWAVDHGADIINLSLAFSPGYVPSRALQDALAEADEAGILLVGAAGNNGMGYLTQPAANPRVLAVGAVTPAAGGGYKLASYSNHGPKVDVVAPGGDINADLNGDGFVDGILGESIDPSDPTNVGYWLMAGTSQAAAIVSGAAAHLLAQGASSSEVPLLLQSTASPGGLVSPTVGPYIEGAGAGLIQISAASEAIGSSFPDGDYHVSLLPWLSTDAQGHLYPSLRVTVFDGDGEVASGVRVVGTLYADVPAAFSCVTSEGSCAVVGLGVDAPVSGQVGMWAFSVDAVVVDGLAFRPGMALGTGPCFEDALEAVSANPATADTILGFLWDETSLDGFGDLAESIVLFNSGTGVVTSPLTVILAPPPGTLGSFSATTLSVLPEEGSACELSSLEVWGGGIATSPLTLLPELLAIPGTLGGGGIATSPLTLLPGLLGVPGTLVGEGIVTSPLTLMPLLPGDLGSYSGSGIVTSPLTLLPIVPDLGTATFSGNGIVTSPLTVSPILPILPVTGVAGGAILLSDDVDPIGRNAAAGRLLGDELAEALLSGGWLTDEATLPASVFFGAGARDGDDVGSVCIAGAGPVAELE
jgi:hypothetical protein